MSIVISNDAYEKKGCGVRGSKPTPEVLLCARRISVNTVIESLYWETLSQFISQNICAV